MENPKRHIITGYALFSLFFLGGLFAYTLFRLNMFSMDNSRSIDAVMENMKSASVGSFQKSGTFDNEDFSRLFASSLDSEPRLQSLVLYSRVKNIIYKAVGKSKLYLDNAFTNNYGSAPVFQTPFGTNVMERQMSLSFQGQSIPVVLAAVYTDFSVKDMHLLLWEIFYILAGFFGMTLLLIVILGLTSRSGPSKHHADMVTDPDIAKYDEPVGYSEPVDYAGTAKKPEKKRKVIEPMSPRANRAAGRDEGEEAMDRKPFRLEDARDNFEEDFSFPDLAGLPDNRILAVDRHDEAGSEAPTENLPRLDEELPPLDEDFARFEDDSALHPGDDSRPAPEHVQDGSSLYSDETGLVKHVFLKERLQAEIERSAQFDEDLSLALVNILTGEAQDMLKDLTHVVHNYFTFHDLSFEYPSGKHHGGCAILIPDEDLDKTSKNCALFQQECAKRGIGTGIGISSRNGRIISPDSLLEEARAALEKACESGKDKIVVFRSDPDKYRKVISS